MDHGLFLKTLHRTIKVNQNDSLKPSIDRNTDLKKKDFDKDFLFKLMNSAVFGKTKKDVSKKDILNLSQ